MKDWKFDERLSKLISPIATLKGSAHSDQRATIDKTILEDRKEYHPEEEFIAIAEGVDMPLYIFTYNIEMT